MTTKIIKPSATGVGEFVTGLCAWGHGFGRQHGDATRHIEQVVTRKCAGECTCRMLLIFRRRTRMNQSYLVYTRYPMFED